MNNKGFAITGILYTIFILFIMTMLAILSGLNTRMKLLEKSVISFQEDYELTEVTDSTDINTMNQQRTALYDGKYVFNTTSSQPCTAYLKKSTSFDSITFIEKDCTNDKQNIALKKAYKFKKENE